MAQPFFIVLLLAAGSTLARVALASSELSRLSTDQIQRAVQFEENLAKNYDRPAADGEPWFRILPGNSQFLLLAPYATSRLRIGQSLPPALGTGALAFILHELTNVTAVYTVARAPVEIVSDESSFAATVEDLVQISRPILVLEFQTAADSAGYAVNLDTSNGKTLSDRQPYVELLLQELRSVGLDPVVQNSSDGFSPANHVSFIGRAGIPGIRLMINPQWLDFLSSSVSRQGESGPPKPPPSLDPARLDRFSRLASALNNFIEEIKRAPGSAR